METNSTPTHQHGHPAEKAPPPTTKSHKGPTLLASALLLVGFAGYAAYWSLSSRYVEITDDAYVDGNSVQVTPQTTGTVTAIKADNTDFVREGALLIVLNPLDAQLALQRAEAQLAKAVRQVRGQYSSSSQLEATIDLRRSELSRAQADLEHRAPLVQTGAISSEDFRHAQDAVKAAQAALIAAEQQSASSAALVDRVSINNHPDVLVAAMQLRDAYIAANRTELRAPVSGMVTKRNVQVGQRVTTGTPLMSIVPLDNVWVTANFKESQLRDLRLGQAVALRSDVYGRSVEYHGTVVGLDAGTGSAFSLMPAQNATGNWIKVVQRVPVRIALDRSQLAEHPLRIGLSMKVEVDIKQTGGKPLSVFSEKRGQAYSTKIFDAESDGADKAIERIITNNSLQGHAVTGKSKS